MPCVAFVIWLVFTTLKIDYLLDNQNHTGSYWHYMLGVVPFCLASFGYQQTPAVAIRKAS
ncbi:hypothetical protein KFO32_23055 (plasmid) [Pantoea ananatis]|nr:hypothetical protein [Pantoea ananatis]